MNPNTFALVAELGLVPIVSIPDPDLAAPLAAALTKGGLPLVEVLMRNECAAQCIARIKADHPGMTVGAGTVLTPAQVDEAKAAGADFIVGPGTSGKVIARCRELNLPVLPGAVTPTEIEAGLDMGFTTFKFFPAEQMGGVPTMEELCGPYGSVRFVATSGITMENMPRYLASDKVTAVGGNFLAPDEMIAAADWDGITALCREAVRRSHQFHLVHVGVNAASAEEGVEMARWFSAAFDLPMHDYERSAFSGTLAEFTKAAFPGKAGHIAMGTPSVERAMAYLSKRGIRFREDFQNIDPQGVYIAAYLEKELGGFSIHLIKHTP